MRRVTSTAYLFLKGLCNSHGRLNELYLAKLEFQVEAKKTDNQQVMN